MAENEIIEFAKIQLTLPDKIDPSDAMSWQHHLYSKLGNKKQIAENDLSQKPPTNLTKQQILDELIDRIVAMSKVLFGLHMVKLLLFHLSIADS
jgi:ryanodine receptor 2